MEKVKEKKRKLKILLRESFISGTSAILIEQKYLNVNERDKIIKEMSNWFQYDGIKNIQEAIVQVREILNNSNPFSLSLKPNIDEVGSLILSFKQVLSNNSGSTTIEISTTIPLNKTSEWLTNEKLLNLNREKAVSLIFALTNC
jgi:hypothetical protein